jgi:TonB family protein
MRRLLGKRIGQSGHELALAVLFSFFLHTLLIVGSFIVYRAVIPKVFLPPAYRVKLVGLPSDLSPTTRGEAPKETPKPDKPKAAHKAKQTARKQAPAAPRKGAMPELDQRKQKAEQVHEVEEKQAAPAEAQKSEGKAEGVAVSPAAEDFKFPYYLAAIHHNIERNWNPPPGAKGIKAKVQFTILRSGWVVKNELKLIASSGNYYFDQAAMRAILQSSPFPQMPEEYPKQSLDLTVDLMERE